MSCVLIIDDGGEEGRFLAEAVAAEGQEPRRTVPGPHAVVVAQVAQPDLIVIDLQSASDRAAQICREIRSLPAVRTIPILLVSDREREAEAVRCLDSGASDWFVRPAPVATLRARIRNLIESKRDRDALRCLRESLERSQSALSSTVDSLYHANEAMARVHRERKFLSTHDALTGLPLRRFFEDFARRAIAFARRHGHLLAVISVDLDGFKQINDAMGHEAGDKLLQSVASRLRECVRGTDMVARPGGDEFTLLLLNLSQSDDAALIADKIVTRLSQPHPVDGSDVYITPSIGIAVFPEHGDTPDSLLSAAEAAMRSVKDNGRNSFRFYEKTESHSARRQLRLEYDLREALDRGQFALYYQPQVDVSKGDLIGAEGLLRWFHPELGLVPPSEFIPIAESSGMIRNIGEWVIHEACRQKKSWEHEGLGAFPISVNVSFRQLKYGNLVDAVARALHETGLDPRHLDLEITENTIMDDLETATEVLTAFQRMGVRISIDDFGTGYSSLSVLGTFPANTLKIDRSFVRNIFEDSTRQTVTRAVIAVANELGLDTIAEGVETVEEMEFVASLGCHRMQGYLFGRPVPAEEFSLQCKEGEDLVPGPGRL